MPKRLLPFALSALLLPAAVMAQENQPSTDSKPAEAQPAPEKKPDTFHYFFGQRSQPAPKAEKEEATAPRKPVDAFDYFFGKDGKADEPEEPQSPPPV